MNISYSEEIRLANAIIKLKGLAKENNYSETETEEVVRESKIKISKN